MKYHEYLEAIVEELLGVWDASADHGETPLIEALGEASEKGESDLARKIFEGAIAYVADELLCGGSKPEVNRLVEQYEREFPEEGYRQFLTDK